MKLFDRSLIAVGTNENYKSKKFSFESDNFRSENKAYAFYIEVENTNVNGCITFIRYDEEGLRSNNFTINPKIMMVFDDLAKAAENGLDAFLNKLKNLETQERRVDMPAKYYAEDIEKSIEQLKCISEGSSHQLGC